MSHSFRFRLAIRFTVALTLGLVVLAVLAFLVIRDALDHHLDASLLAVASIQAASVTDGPPGEMHLHEWELTPEEAERIGDLNRFAEIWSADGESLLRSRYLTTSLPLDTAALRHALDGRMISVEATFQGRPIHSLYYPLGRGNGQHGTHVLQIAAPLDTRNALLRQSVLLMIVTILGTAAGTLGGSWWLAGRAIRPVHEIIDQAEGIGAQTLRRRISAHPDSREYERLVQVLNTMLGRIDASFEAQRRFAADASHELRSPLTVLQGELELARRRPRAPEEYGRVIDSALEEVVRLSRVVDDLLTLARSDAGVLQARLSEVDVRECARDVIERLDVSAQIKNVRLTVTGTRDAKVTGDRDLVSRLLWNLVTNGIQHTPPGGDVTVTVARRNGTVTARVTDTGPGIPGESLPHIFERFYRADQARTPALGQQGTGLGLAIVHAIAELHGARVTASNRPEGGAEFDIWFPAQNGTDHSTA